LRADVASGSAPDIFWLNSANFLSYANAGELVKIDESIGDQGFSGWEESVVAQFSSGGVLWGVPQLSDPGIGILYNSQLLEDAGLEPADLLDMQWDPKLEDDDLRSITRRLTVDDAGRTADDAAFDSDRVASWGYSAANDLNAILLPFIGSNGATWQDGDVFTFDSPGGTEAISYIIDLINEQHVSPPTSITNPPAGGNASLDLFLRGRIALFQTGAYNLVNVLEGASFPWGIAPLPRGPAGAISGTNGIVASGWSGSDAPSATRTVLEWMGSGEGSAPIGATGTANPAVISAQQEYRDFWRANAVDVTPLLEVLSNGSVQPPQGERYAAAQDAYLPILNEVFLGQRPVEEGVRTAATLANEAMKP
jgi:multiple sugar transport system substrate-binding protein